MSAQVLVLLETVKRLLDGVRMKIGNWAYPRGRVDETHNWILAENWIAIEIRERWLKLMKIGGVEWIGAEREREKDKERAAWLRV